MNGGGKTTIFDAIQLALYGPRARCSKRAGRSYDDFLRASINNAVSPATGAGVALSFRVAVSGEQNTYEVRRDWKVQDGKVKEELYVLHNGFPDTTITRQWSQLVEELVPIEISQLFFFDGEKIRALAEDATSSETLGTAIRALLGLDIVERLIADSSVLQSRLVKQAGDPAKATEVETIEQERDAAREAMARLKQERASLENSLLRAADEQKKAEEEFALVGGKHWEEHQNRRERLAEVERLCAELETQLMALAGSDLPLALVPDLLTAVAEQDAQERISAESAFVRGLLLERDEAVIAALGKHAEFTRGRLAVLTKVLADDREKRAPGQSVEARLSLHDPSRGYLSHLRETRLSELKADANRLLDRLQRASTEREDLERLLAATPNEADIGKVVEKLRTATQAHTRLDEQAKKLDAEIEQRRAEVAVAEGKLNANLQADAKAEFSHTDFTRMAELATKTRATMAEFLRRATEKKIDRLSGLITDSFRFLLRKGSLVERIQIDATTFAVTLFDAQGQPLSRDRLSEGEKQIFAVSMLWGLARASSRPLPAIVDTPMARLDSAHRTNLIERYFPKASHQVVILSTDTEVDRAYYERLRPALARAYHLRYDEKERSATAEEGYFWQD
jgi:DNA sulfur modification protein DndD